MRKIRLLLVVLFIFSLTLTSCQGNSEFQGYWIVTSLESGGQLMNLDEIFTDGKYGFISIEGGKKYVSFLGQNGISRGKWETTEKGIKLTDERDSSQIEIEKDGEKLVINVPNIARYEFTKTDKKPDSYDEVVKTIK